MINAAYFISKGGSVSVGISRLGILSRLSSFIMPSRTGPWLSSILRTAPETFPRLLALLWSIGAVSLEGFEKTRLYE